MRTPSSEPKRNSGRTGRRRLTAAEAALAGPKTAYEHQRLYGAQGPRSALPDLPDPPVWFSAELIAIWQATIAAAPPGLLAAIDADNLAAYCLAVDMHRRLARKAAACRTSLPKELERRLRLAAAELGRASKALGLQPYDRNRMVIPPPPPELPTNPHLRSVTLVEGGNVRGVYRVGRK